MIHRLWRQDDNGNEVVVRDFASADDAEQLREALESTGHRQIYWIERVDETVNGDDDPCGSSPPPGSSRS